MDGDNSDERFAPTGGRVAGAVMVGIGIATVLLALIGDPLSWTAVAAGVLVAAVGWVTFLRPRVAILGDELLLRGMVQDVRVPIAAVEEVVVQQVLALRVGRRRLTSVAVGRSRRQIRSDDRSQRPDRPGPLADPDRAYGTYVEERIRMRAEAARQRLGLRRYSDELDDLAARVRRRPAVPEVVVLVGSAVALVVLLTT